MIVSGNPINAEKAAKVGLVDRVVEGDVVAGAIAFARELVAAGKGPRPTGATRIDPRKPAGGPVRQEARVDRAASLGPDGGKELHRRRRGRVGSDYKTGLERERELFAGAGRQAPTPARCSTPSSPSGRPPTFPTSART